MNIYDKYKDIYNKSGDWIKVGSLANFKKIKDTFYDTRHKAVVGDYHGDGMYYKITYRQNCNCKKRCRCFKPYIVELIHENQISEIITNHYTDLMKYYDY